MVYTTSNSMMYIITLAAKVRLLIISSAMLFILCACDFSVEKVHKVKSPDEKIDAVMIAEASGGALGSILYRVYISGNGVDEKYSNKDIVFDAVHLEDTCLGWRDNRSLVIYYSSGRVLNVKPCQYVDVRGEKEQVTVDVQIVPRHRGCY